MAPANQRNGTRKPAEWHQPIPYLNHIREQARQRNSTRKQAEWDQPIPYLSHIGE